MMTFRQYCLILTLLLVVSSTTTDAELQPRCGDCWCIYNGESDQCPTDQTGIADIFPAETFQIYQTFNLVNADASYLKLQTADGEECYPFADTLGPLANYPKSNLPLCAMPESTNETVCAFLYEEGMACQGRNYQVLTYDSAAEAKAAGAVVTHQGACGVCSNAADLWARMSSIDDFETDTLICGVSYLLNPDKDNRFDELWKCAEKAGLSEQCALLWAHYGAATISACSDVCNAGTGAETNGSPPECEYTPCLKCSRELGGNFNPIAGRSMPGSGISQGTAEACSSFTRIDHDPCVGATSGSEISPTPAPTTAPSASVMAAAPTTWSIVLLTMLAVTGATSVAIC